LLVVLSDRRTNMRQGNAEPRRRYRPLLRSAPSHLETVCQRQACSHPVGTGRFPGLRKGGPAHDGTMRWWKKREISRRIGSEYTVY